MGLIGDWLNCHSHSESFEDLNIKISNLSFLRSITTKDEFRILTVLRSSQQVDVRIYYLASFGRFFWPVINVFSSFFFAAGM